MLAFYMAAAGLAALMISLWRSRGEIAAPRGVDKVVALTYLCFAVPLAVFGAEHFTSGKFMLDLVPRYMPFRWFWIYFVGCALLAASVSIATRILIRWSALFFGIMMFLFVAMLYFPGAIATGARLTWTIVFREMSFGGGGWVLAGIAMGGSRRRVLVTIGRIVIAFAAIFFGVQHFLHPHGIPVVPLQKQTPAWVPAPTLIDYLTGVFLVAAGICFLTAWRVGIAATYLGAWIVLIVVAIYTPVLFGALADPNVGVKIEGLNYFADTLLFGAVILSLALERRVVP